MRISDWSSDVCSSDLADIGDRVLTIPVAAIAGGIDRFGTHPAFERLEHRPARSRRQVHVEVGGERIGVEHVAENDVGAGPAVDRVEIGRASGRERGCQSVWVWVVGVALKTKK